MATTLANLLLGAKDRSDLLNNTVVNDVTWRRWANQAVEKLYRNLVVKAPARWHKSVFFTLAGGFGLNNNTIQLAADFRQLRPQGVTKDPLAPGSRRSLHKFDFAARDAQGQLPAWGSGRELGYDIQGSTGLANLVIEPAQLAAGSYAYNYLAGPVAWLTDGTQDGTAIAALLEPYVDFVEVDMAIKGARKDENFELSGELRDENKDRLDEILAEFNDGSDPSAIIDVDEVGGKVWP